MHSVFWSGEPEKKKRVRLEDVGVDKIILKLLLTKQD